MKKIIKQVLLILLAALIIIQFFHPEKNKHDQPAAVEKDIATLYPYPDSVKQLLQTSCYDCHSNNTIYPWYSKLQPVDWWLNSHVTEGKRELNFNEFASYSLRKQYGKLKKIGDEVKEGGMPLSSYTLIHTDAKLDDKQKNIIINWANGVRDSMKNKYPADSLIKK